MKLHGGSDRRRPDPTFGGDPVWEALQRDIVQRARRERMAREGPG